MQRNEKEDFKMRKTTRRSWPAFLSLALAGALLSLTLVARVAASGTPVQPQQRNQEAAEAAARLNKKQFRDVRVTVSNGIATLTGSVSLYEFKADAQKQVLHAKSVNAVRNLIRVAGPNISDQALQAKLQEKLAYNQEGYGNLFDAITLNVRNGVATLGGHVHNYVNRDSALALVATTPGVKDMIDDMEVDPVSSMDWEIRLAVARAIYGYPTMNKYAINPIRPIRISVQNGHVELYGTVDSQADKDTAYIRANSVSGVFSVKNYLQVAGQPTGAK